MRLDRGLSLLLFALFGGTSAHGQKVLSARQITSAEALGRRTDIPLKLGTLVQSAKGDGFQAFITLPEQRVAYAVSDMTSKSHGSGAKDPLVSELHLNRLRVTGLPYGTSGFAQHNTRLVILCNSANQGCIKPSHEVLDVNQVVAEFEWPAVLALAGPQQLVILTIQNNVGGFQPPVHISLATLNKSR